GRLLIESNERAPEKEEECAAGKRKCVAVKLAGSDEGQADGQQRHADQPGAAHQGGRRGCRRKHPPGGESDEQEYEKRKWISATAREVPGVAEELTDVHGLVPADRGNTLVLVPTKQWVQGSARRLPHGDGPSEEGGDTRAAADCNGPELVSARAWNDDRTDNDKEHDCRGNACSDRDDRSGGDADCGRRHDSAALVHRLSSKAKDQHERAEGDE